MKNSEPRVIQFSHPGKQINLSRRSKFKDKKYSFNDYLDSHGVRFWNSLRDDHYRKFIESKGLVLENNEGEIASVTQQKTLLFWGEWEAKSRFKLLAHKDKLLPNAVHFPFVGLDETLRGKHNTDPYVFGNCFYYTNCKQARNGMNALQDNSLIIFGTEYHSSKFSGFVVDTVFVVKNSKPLESTSSYSNIFRKVNLDVVKRQYDNYEEFKIYESLTFEDNSNFFSYVPCRVKNKDTEQGFARPILDYKKFRLKNPGAGMVLDDVKEATPLDYWQELTGEIINQGFDLAVQIDEPQ